MLHLSRNQMAYGAGLLALAIGGGWYGMRARAPRTVAPHPQQVSVARVAISDFPLEMDGIGHVQAYNTVNVMAQVPGQVVKIAFQEGKPVSAGGEGAGEKAPYDSKALKTVLTSR